MRRWLVGIIIGLLFPVGICFADPEAEIIDRAVEAAAKGKVRESFLHLKRLRELGVESGKFSFDLGVMARENGELGLAVSELRNAARIYPLSREILEQLAQVRTVTGDVKVEPQLYLSIGLSRGFQRVMVLVSVVLLFITLLGTSMLAKTVTGLLTLGAFGVLMFSELSLSANGLRDGVFIARSDNTKVYGGPDGSSQVVELVRAGRELKVFDQSPSSLAVQLPSGRSGWVKSADGFYEGL